MPFSIVPLVPPQTLLLCPVNSGGTSPIPVGVATPGKQVHIAGWYLSGGTTIIFQSNSTEIFRVTTTGLAVRLPEAKWVNELTFPLMSSNPGEIINVVPAASGMTGVVYYWIF